MLNYLYSWSCYRNLKTGLLLDFYFKRIFLKFAYYIFKNFSLYFGDKYLIEYIAVNIYFIYTKLTFFIVNYLKLSYLRLLLMILIQLIFFGYMYSIFFLL